MIDEITRLGDFCYFIAGSAFPERYQGKTEGDFPFIKVSDMKLSRNKSRINEANNWLNQKEADILRVKPVPPGSVVFAKIGVGLYNNRMRLTTMPTLLDNNMMAAVPREGVSSNVLYSIMNTIDMQTWAIGAALPYIRASDIVKIKLSHVDNDNLSIISKIELALNSAIDVQNAMSDCANSIISEVFHSWFIDFNPVKMKVAGKIPFGMTEETMALFPNSFEESEIGLIPAGWTVKKIGDIAELIKGLSYTGAFLEETIDSGKEMLNLGCFGIDGSFRRNKIKYYSGEHRERHLLKQGDLLIANTDMTQDRVILGAGIVIPSEYEGALFTHHTTRLRAHENLDFRLNSFLAHQLSQPTFRHIAEGYSTGSTVLALPKDAILNYKIVIPPKELLNKFLSLNNDFFSHSQVLISIEEELQNARDVLVPRLMFGELPISLING